MTSRIGLVLTGGGARGAYQAGVIRGLADLAPAGSPQPFRILVGTSAGAINAVALAGATGDFAATASALWDTWADLTPDRIFRTDLASIAPLALRWARDLALGGLLDRSTSTHLLDTAPLRALLAARLDPDRVAENIRSGRLHAVAISATSYRSGTAVTFFSGAPEVQPWSRSSRVGVRARLGLAHVMASAAIPGFFPPEPYAGTYWGDGCIRLTAPLSPAIHLGADQVLAIGTRHARPPALARSGAFAPMPRISAIDVGGVLLNAVFLDALEADLERMLRINRTISRLGTAATGELREIPVEVVVPSQDLGRLAAAELRRLPRTLRYMLRGLGASDETGWDVLSYLAFDRTYTRRLLELGRADAHAAAATLGPLIGSAQALRVGAEGRITCAPSTRGGP